MIRKIIFLLLVVCSLRSQEIFYYYYQGSNQYWTPTFSPAIDTNDGTKPFTPYSSSYLYFSGGTNGAFCRNLASSSDQYAFNLVNATTDSFDVTIESYCVTTGRYLAGKLGGASGWAIGVGVSAGANLVEFYLQGIGFTTIDTVAGDTTWHTYRVKYNKAQTTLQAWVDGVRTVNNTSAVSTCVVNARATTWGNFDSPISVSDTTQKPTAGFYWKGGIRQFTWAVWTGATDTTYTYYFTGYGQSIFCKITSLGAVIANGWLEQDRANYTATIESNHFERGGFAGIDRKDPLWVNTGTAPTYVAKVGNGIMQFDSSANNFHNGGEAFANGEGKFDSAYLGINKYIVVGGVFNNINGAVDAFGLYAHRLAMYNLTTLEWRGFGAYFTGGSVFALAQYNDSLLVVVGDFTAIGAVARTRAFGLYNFKTATFLSLDSGFNASVSRVWCVGTNIIVSGGFTASGGTTLTRVAISRNLGEWQPFGSGVSGAIQAMTIYNTDTIFSGGFATFNGVSVTGICKWNGSTAVAMGGITGTIYCLAVYNGKLVAGGNFSIAGGIAVTNLAQYDGTNWTALGSATTGTATANVGINDMKVETVHNVLILEGWFTGLGGKRVGHLGFYNGRDFIIGPPSENLNEGVLIDGVRIWFVGDSPSAYGINDVNGVFEIIPIWKR